MYCTVTKLSDKSKEREKKIIIGRVIISRDDAFSKNNYSIRVCVLTKPG